MTDELPIFQSTMLEILIHRIKHRFAWRPEATDSYQENVDYFLGVDMGEPLERQEFPPTRTYRIGIGRRGGASRPGGMIVDEDRYLHDGSRSTGSDGYSLDMLDFLADTASFEERCSHLLDEDKGPKSWPLANRGRNR